MALERLRPHGRLVATAFLSLTGSIFVLSAASAAPVDRAPLGWDVPPAVLPGQEIQRVTCPPRSYLTGFREVLGYWLYEIWPFCAPINPQGLWTDWPSRAGILTPIGGLGATGVNDFLVTSLTCPDDSYVIGLSGVIVRAKDENEKSLGVVRMPGLIRPACRKRADPTDLPPTNKIRDWTRPEYQKIPWASFEDPEFIGWGGPGSPSTCRPDEVAIGAWVVRDQWLKSVGLICESFETMRPKTPSESGAGQVPVPGVRPGLDSAVPGVRPGIDSTVPGVRPGIDSPVGTGPRALGRDQIPAAHGLRPGIVTSPDSKSPPPPGSSERPSTTGNEPEPPPIILREPFDRSGVGVPWRGASVRAACPPGSAMTNTWVVVDDRSLLEIEIWCTGVDSQGAWSGPAFHSEAPAIMLARGFALDDDSVFDKLRKMDCPTGFYVAGFNPGISLVDSRFVPWHAFTECRRPGDGALKEAAYVIPSGATNEDRHLIGWDGVGGQRSCAADEVGVGIWGAASQDRVEAFGMVCALWAKVRPGSPVEKGAAQVPAPVDPVAEAKRTSVPAGKTYVIVNKLGQKIREFKAGEATTMTRECVPVECSRSVMRAARGSQVTCWRCGQD